MDDADLGRYSPQQSDKVEHAHCFQKGPRMSIYYDRQVELDKYEFQFGRERGRLAVSLDALTDALILIGQHGVYCRSARNPELPALDLQRVLGDINGAKQLVSDVMAMLAEQTDARRAQVERGQTNG